MRRCSGGHWVGQRGSGKGILVNAWRPDEGGGCAATDPGWSKRVRCEFGGSPSTLPGYGGLGRYQLVLKRSERGWSSHHRKETNGGLTWAAFSVSFGSCAVKGDFGSVWEACLKHQFRNWEVGSIGKVSAEQAGVLTLRLSVKACLATSEAQQRQSALWAFLASQSGPIGELQTQ